MQDLDTLIWSMSMIRIKPGISEPEISKWRNIPHEAQECSIYYCVNSYSSRVANGLLTEVVQEQTSIRRDPNSWQLLAPDGLSSTTLNTSMKHSIAFDPAMSTFPRTDLPLGDRYNISQTAVDSISIFMTSTFANDLMRYPHTNINGWSIDDGTKQYQPDSMQILSIAPDLHGTFDNVATSMSNAIRAGADGSPKVYGEVVDQVTIYHVAWVWAALPLFVVLASLVQLVLSMVQSARTRTPLWRTSSLAVLSRGPYTMEALGKVETLSEMEAAAEHSSVTLFPDRTRNRLSQC